MCGFKPGDEVVCVNDQYVHGLCRGIVKGEVYTIRAVVRPVNGRNIVVDHARWLVELEEVTWDTGCPHIRGAYRPERFRKVQRRDISAWLETAAKDTDHLDRRAPAKEPV